MHKPGIWWLHVALLWKCRAAGRELEQQNEDPVLEEDETKIHITCGQGGYSSPEQEKHWLCSLVDYLRNTFCFPLAVEQTAGRQKNAATDTKAFPGMHSPSVCATVFCFQTKAYLPLFPFILCNRKKQ